MVRATGIRVTSTTPKSGGPGFKPSTPTLTGFIHVFSEFKSSIALCKTQLVCLLLVGIFKHYVYLFIRIGSEKPHWGDDQ